MICVECCRITKKLFFWQETVCNICFLLYSEAAGKVCTYISVTLFQFCFISLSQLFADVGFCVFHRRLSSAWSSVGADFTRALELSWRQHWSPSSLSDPVSVEQPPVFPVRGDVTHWHQLAASEDQPTGSLTPQPWMFLTPPLSAALLSRHAWSFQLFQGIFYLVGLNSSLNRIIKSLKPVVKIHIYGLHSI